MSIKQSVFTWCFPSENYDQIHAALDKLQKEYTDKAAKLILDLPEKLHPEAYHYAKDVEINLVFALSKECFARKKQ